MRQGAARGTGDSDRVYQSAMTAATLLLMLAGALLSPTPADADLHGRAGSHAADRAFSAPDAMPGSGFIEVEPGSTAPPPLRTAAARLRGRGPQAPIGRAASAPLTAHVRTPSAQATRHMLARSGRLSAPPTAPPTRV